MPIESIYNFTEPRSSRRTPERKPKKKAVKKTKPPRTNFDVWKERLKITELKILLNMSDCCMNCPVYRRHKGLAKPDCMTSDERCIEALRQWAEQEITDE